MYRYKTSDEIRGVKPDGPEFAEEYIEGYFQKYQRDPEDKTAAFMALRLIAHAVSEDADRDPRQEVPVPLWILQALAPGLLAYPHVRDRMTLDQALGIKPLKSGAHHELVKEAKREDKRNITLEVAQMIGPEPKHGDVDEAVKAVADERGISKSKVWKAWGVYGDAAQEALKRERVWDRLNHNKILP